LTAPEGTPAIDQTLTAQADPPPADEAPAPEPLRPRRRWLSFRRVFYGGAFFGLIAVLALATAVVATNPPDPSGPLPQPAVVLVSADGEVFARRGAYKEAPVDAGALPRHVVDAIIAIEDKRFYNHYGFDLRGIGRAAVINLRAGKVVQGGSTLTQQLAKLSLRDRRRSFWRKGREAIIAASLELKLSKQEILSRYLSSAYYGDGVWGLRAASKHYFSKLPEKLTLAEGAMLAGVVNAPSRLAPTYHLREAQARGRIVLTAMADQELITRARARVRPARLNPGRKTRPLAPYFADWIGPQIDFGDTPQFGEVEVGTTLDADLQRRAESVVRRSLTGQGKSRGASQAALVAMRPDGSVVAMVGGRDYRESQFNRAVQAKRQTGSAFKLFVYLAALRSGANPDSLVDDAPITIGGWSPQNFDGRSHGVMTLQEALATSNNIAAVKISEKVGRRSVIRAARDLGWSGTLEPVASLPLGAGAASPLEMTSAYAAVAAGAYPVIPTGFADREPPTGQRPLREQEPLMQMLSAPVDYGTARAAAIDRPAYGKTGTTQDNRDAWFIGFADDLVVGVWVGNDDETPMRGVTGSGMPARIWRDFVSASLPAAVQWRDPEMIEEDRAPERPGWLRRLERFFGLDS